MARLYQTGAELNTLTAGIEITSLANSPTVVSTIVHSGAYSFRANPTAGIQSIVYQIASDATSGTYLIRAYLRIVSLPSSGSTAIIRVLSAAAGLSGDIRLTSAGVLQLFQRGNTQVGSNSSALSVGINYLIELKIAATNASTGELRGSINSVEFAGSASASTDRVDTVRWGCASSTTADLYFDTIAINESSGSFQTSYPGQGKIVHLRPNAAGDNTAWTGAYTDVDEVTPDDATTLLSSNTLDQIEDMNIDSPAMMGDRDTINVVAVGVRYNGAGASANASFVLRIKASASGTVEESSAITPSNTTWVTNANSSPRNYPLVLYDLPGASTTAWTKNDLEQAQIGVRLSATSTNAAQVSTLWASVDYVPVFGPMNPKPRNPKINWRI